MSENKVTLMDNLEIIDVESNIRRLEVELQSHQEKMRLFEISIKEEQKSLAEMKKDVTRQEFVAGEYHDKN